MANDRNLSHAHDFDKIDPEKLREISRKGAYASNKARKERRRFREMLEYAAKQKAKSAPDLALAEDAGMDEHTQQDIIVASLVNQCKLGNVKAIELYLKIFGEMPADVVKQEVELKESKADKLAADLFGDDSK